MRPEPPDFDPMFQAGARYRLPDPAGTVAVVEVHDAGLLHLPTGRVVACDPFWGSEVRRQVAPFTVTVPPGRYPVTLSSARGLLVRPHPVPRLGAAAKWMGRRGVCHLDRPRRGGGAGVLCRRPARVLGQLRPDR